MMWQRVGTGKGAIEDLDFADNLALLSDNSQRMQLKTTRLEEMARTLGFNINSSRTKIKVINGVGDQKMQVSTKDLEVAEFT